MSEAPRDILMDHYYDGIQEFDNPTPGWWWYLFNATIFFSICYFIFFQFSSYAWTDKSYYDQTVAENLQLQFGEIGTLVNDEATILKYMKDDKWLLVGKTVFAGRCVSCHGSNAAGVIGPNLTDNNYKNVKKIADIGTVIANGAANGAMPAWKTQLHPNEVVLTAAYIASMRGQNIAGRAPEGDVIPPWPVAPAAPAEPAKEPK